MLKRGGLRQAATAIPATFAIVAPIALPKVAKVAKVAVANTPKQAANDPAIQAKTPPDGKVTARVGATADPDRWCWPHSTAMTGTEIDTFTTRLARFTDKGFSLDDSEALADRLVARDRDGDDRHLCAECAHCRFGMRCAKKLAALDILQRCDHFTSNTNL